MVSRRVVPVVLVALVSVACAPLPRDSGESGEHEAQTTAAASDVMAKLPLSFVENRGQIPDRDIALYVSTPTASIGFTAEGLRFTLADRRGTTQNWGLALDFVGGRARPVAEDLQEGVVSYFKGDPNEWKTNLPTHGTLVYRDLWPRIDLQYRADGPKLKYEVLVHPGGDPDDIRFRWRGATSVSLDPDGSLTTSTPAGSITDAPPVSFQGDADVATSYELTGRTYGFRVGDYDRARPLVIDPLMVAYAGYVGGSGDDRGNAIAVDASGAVYIAGNTNSDATAFPETVGPFLAKGAGVDAFVAKVNPTGTGLVYAGYVGGANFDSGQGVAVDPSGAAYLTGNTRSDSATFPVTVGPDLSYNGGVDFGDAYVAKVNSSGTALSYAGYIGGSSDEQGHAIAVDASGAAYVGGYTQSDATTFPDTVGPFLTHGGGGLDNDGFVAKVNPSGTALSYAGYIGGNNQDLVNGMAVDAVGAAYLVGQTDSDTATFPETVGPILTRNLGTDAFVAKVNPSGTALSYAGFIGGASFDFGHGIAVDTTGAAYVIGETVSDPASFPETVGPSLTYGGNGDAFVAKVNPSGTALSYAGYVGGDGGDAGYAIAVDASGAAYIAGATSSDAATFPETVGPFLAKGAGVDAFVAKVNPAGTGFSYAGYIGGAGEDSGRGIAVDPTGAATLTGYTNSEASTFPETVGPFLSKSVGLDAFVAKITDNFCLGRGVTMVGTGGADTIAGTPGDDVILSLGGDDTIDGAGGSDFICAGDGNDVLVGGAGDDRLDGEGGSDTASYAGTSSVIVDLAAGSGSGQGSDTLASIENVIGSSTEDFLRGDGGGNWLQGGLGADRLSGRLGRDRLSGQAGPDNLLGGRGNDRLSGGKGRDRMSGGKGRDRCAGGKGRDTATSCEKLSGVP